jgi:hypothetical protein
MVSEGAWDVGGGAGCLAGAAVTATGHSLAWAILLGAPAAIATVVLLTRHYGRRVAIAQL